MSFNFRKARSTPLVSHDEQVRQGRVVKAAQAALGNIDAVRDFLNSPHPRLSGRPLDLAVASHAGLMAVEAEIYAEGLRRGAAT